MGKKNTTEKTNITYTRSPAKHGSEADDFVFTIPRIYIQNNLVNPNKTYNVILGDRQISFIRTPAKHGGKSDFDYHFKIPRIYIRNNLVDSKKNYKITLEEAPEKPEAPD